MMYKIFYITRAPITIIRASKCQLLKVGYLASPVKFLTFSVSLFSFRMSTTPKKKRSVEARMRAKAKDDSSERWHLLPMPCLVCCESYCSLTDQQFAIARGCDGTHFEHVSYSGVETSFAALNLSLVMPIENDIKCLKITEDDLHGSEVVDTQKHYKEKGTWLCREGIQASSP